MLLGTRLRQLRENRNYTQEAVAADLALGHSIVSAYETGSRAISLDRLTDFAAYYGISLAELIGSLPIPSDSP